MTRRRTRRRLGSLRCAGLAVVLGLAACAPGDPGATPADPAQTPAQTPTAAASTPPAQSPSPSPAPPSRFSIVATGDLLLHERIWAQARMDAKGAGMDFTPMLASIGGYVSTASLGLCHMETPLAPRQGPFAGYPLFSGPPHIVDTLDALGYDACSTASNHTFDKSAAGIERTLDELDRAGIAHAGSARTQAEARRITIIDVPTSDGAEARVALLSYTYGFNGLPYPDGQRWRSNLLDADEIAAKAGRAREQGADVVVLSAHWGTEYNQTPDRMQRDLTAALAKAGGVDLVIGHHAHVVQPIERRGSMWIAYGHGNLIAAHRTPGSANAEGLLTRWTFQSTPEQGWIISRAEYLPLLVTDQHPVRVLDVAKALATGNFGSSSQSRLRSALQRTVRVVESGGAEQQGLRRIRPQPGT